MHYSDFFGQLQIFMTTLYVTIKSSKYNTLNLVRLDLMNVFELYVYVFVGPCLKAKRWPCPWSPTESAEAAAAEVASILHINQKAFWQLNLAKKTPLATWPGKKDE